jgi:membrane protein implicated in regulation of membrane protease activity
MIEFFSGLHFWHWLALAVVLGILDVLIGANFFFVWCGIAAAVVGALLFYMPNIGWEMQFLIFGIGSMCSFFVWRKFATHGKDAVNKGRLNQRAAQYIGRTFTLQEPIVNGRGKVRVDDTIWRVEGEDLPSGEQIKIVDVDGVVLKIEKSN